MLIAGFHHPHMGQMVAGQIKAGQVDAVGIAFQRFKQPRGDALGGFALVVAGEHAVDVGVVGGPETPAHIHRKLVGAGHHQDAAGRVQLPGGFGRFQGADQPPADVHLLNFIAAQSAHNGETFLALGAEEPGPHRQGRAIGCIDGEQDGLSHTSSSLLSAYASRMRAIREPS